MNRQIWSTNTSDSKVEFLCFGIGTLSFCKKNSSIWEVELLHKDKKTEE